MGRLDDLKLADGRITKVSIDGSSARVMIQDWREESLILVFHDLVGFEGQAPIHDDLSHGTETKDDPFLEKSCLACEEDPREFRSFLIFSAWTDAPLLKVVARSFELIRPPDSRSSTAG